MSIVDILLIVFVALGWLFGLSGKIAKKISSLIIVILSVVAAYFTCGLVLDKLCGIDAAPLSFLGAEEGQTIGEFLSGKITGIVGNLGVPESSVSGLVDGLLKLVVFWLESIVLIIVLNLVLGLICSIIFHKHKRGTAKFSLGIFGLVKGAIIGVVFLFPIFALSPLLSNASSLVKDNKIVDKLSSHVQSSYAIEYGDKFLNSWQPKCLVYTTTDDQGNETEHYLYDDVKSLGGVAKLADIFMPGEDGETKDPIATIASLEPDELREIFENIEQSETVKEIIGGVLDDALEGTGINIDVSEIDFAKEADTFIALQSFVEVTDDGYDFKAPTDITPEAIDDLVGAMAKSDLIEAVAENADGMLARLDTSVQNDIKSALGEKLAGGDIDQDKYDNLMKLFGNQD